MSFNKYPYTDFHEMNDDWVISKVKELIAAWTETKSDWEQVQSDWETQQQAFDDLKSFCENYFNDLDVSTEINNKIDAMVASGTFGDLLEPYVITNLPTAVSGWLTDHVDPDTGYVIDDSLTVSGAAADAKVTGNNIFSLKDIIRDDNSYDVLTIANKTDSSSGGIEFEFSGDSCRVHGTASATVGHNLIHSTSSLPYGVKAGGTYFLHFSGTSVSVQIYFSTDGTTYIDPPTYTLYSDSVIAVPSGAVGMLIRFRVGNGTVLDETVKMPRLLTAYSNKDLYDIITTQTDYNYGASLNNETDCNNMVTNGVWFISTTGGGQSALDHFAYDSPAWLVVKNIGTAANVGVLQIVFPWNPTYYSPKFRTRRSGNTWSDWKDWGVSNTNNYTFNEYSNTYTQTVSPSITTDTNAYLAPTGDTTDVTASIIALLNSNGICRLGKGDYYVSNLEMPAKTKIVGCGYGTRIILSGSSSGYAIKMNNFTSVSDCYIVGNTSGIPLSGTVGDRHGILWQGTYTSDETPDNQPKMSNISNVWIEAFTGGGITCYDTGLGTYNALEVESAYIIDCNAGLNISYWSEYHKFTNVRTVACYYGCINNGGNNVFTNCDFSSCKLAFLMDNSTSQSPNNSHGSCVACVFNHTNSNAGYGIKILGCGNGFVFDGCQIFYSQIDIENSKGIVIGNCNFGYTNCDITISGGDTVLFSSCIFEQTPTITISSNTKTHFANCYERSSGNAVTGS